MSRNGMSDDQGFCTLLERLATDPAGWQGQAGADFVELMSDLLQRKSAWIQAQVGTSGVMADPSDVLSEAVMVVSGTAGVDLEANVRRILAMDNPLGYVVAAVSANTSRAVLSERMGVEARQVRAGHTPVTHLEGMSEPSGAAFLERRDVVAAWARSPQSTESGPPRVSRQFAGVLVGRFQIRAIAVRAALDVAADIAVADDAGAGMTSATTRRRLSRFCGESASLARVGLSRLQVRAMGWLLFGTERHPEWSLLAECARAERARDAITVTAWQARQARELRHPRRSRGGTSAGRLQPELFDPEASPRRTQVVRRSA